MGAGVGTGAGGGTGAGNGTGAGAGGAATGSAAGACSAAGSTLVAEVVSMTFWLSTDGVSEPDAPAIVASTNTAAMPFRIFLPTERLGLAALAGATGKLAGVSLIGIEMGGACRTGVLPHCVACRL